MHRVYLFPHPYFTQHSTILHSKSNKFYRPIYNHPVIQQSKDVPKIGAILTTQIQGFDQQYETRTRSNSVPSSYLSSGEEYVNYAFGHIDIKQKNTGVQYKNEHSSVVKQYELDTSNKVQVINRVLQPQLPAFDTQDTRVQKSMTSLNIADSAILSEVAVEALLDGSVAQSHPEKPPQTSYNLKKIQL